MTVSPSSRHRTFCEFQLSEGQCYRVHIGNVISNGSDYDHNLAEFVARVAALDERQLGVWRNVVPEAKTVTG